ncbi:MAG: SRPBCC family protein [Actinomycetota bacterium]
MARYITSVRTPLRAGDAFALVADLQNLPDWDPGVADAEQIVGIGPGPDSVYAVELSSGMDLRYETIAFEGPRSVILEARTRWFSSTDIISARPLGEGSVVTYDATLSLNGIARLGDPFLRLAFGRIGDRAAAGLRSMLDGEFVT